MKIEVDEGEIVIEFDDGQYVQITIAEAEILLSELPDIVREAKEYASILTRLGVK